MRAQTELPLEVTRVLCITGPASLINKRELRRFFNSICNCEPVEMPNDSTGFEVRFASYHSRVGVAYHRVKEATKFKNRLPEVSVRLVRDHCDV